jgi:GT2 family glycosyltransferase
VGDPVSATAPEPPSRPSPGPRVYVLILNWKGWRDTLECLESVLRQRYENFRVVICDNGSPDDSVERILSWAAGGRSEQIRIDSPLRGLSCPPVAKPIEVSVLDRSSAERGGSGEECLLTVIQTGGNLGYAGGNNVGIRYALARGDADYIWLLNNDTVIDPDALLRMVEHAERDPTVGIVGSKLLMYEQPDVVQAIAGARLRAWQGMAHLVDAGEPDDGRWSEPVEVDCVLGASLLIRTPVIDQIGLLDERYFMYAEELDWCWRARVRGWRCEYAPGSTVWHKVGRSAGLKSPFQEYHSARSTLLFMQKHFPGLLPVAFGYSLYRVLLPKLVRLQPERARAVLRAWRDFFLDRRTAAT